MDMVPIHMRNAMIGAYPTMVPGSQSLMTGVHGWNANGPTSTTTNGETCVVKRTEYSIRVLPP